MTYLVCYATKEFYNSQTELIESAKKYNIDKVFSYKKKDLKRTSFYKQHKEILKQRRGGGYWLWKPFYILNTLQIIEDGDVLIYLDSGIKIVNDITPLINICKTNKSGCMFFSDFSRNNSMLTKGDCFYLMGCDESKYKDAPNLNDGMQIYVKSEHTVSLVKEWLNYCTNKYILTDIPNKYSNGNCGDFVDHRHDQSVLSLLAVKYNIEIYRDPSQFGDYLKMTGFRNKSDYVISGYANESKINSPYGTIFDVHRRRSITIKGRIKNIITKFKF